MRVAIFTETFLPKMDGIVRVVCLFADHLKARGIEVMIIAPNLGTEPLTEYNGMPVVTVSGVTMPWYPELRITPPSLGVYRALKDFQPDVAHFFHPVTVGIPGLMMAKRMGISTLVSYHLDFAQMAQHFNYGPFNLGFLRPAINYLTKMVFNAGDYTLAPSKFIQQQMQATGIQEVGLWKRGVDAERFNPRFYSDEMRYRLSGGNPDDKLLLYVGRLSGEKRIQDIRAVLDRVPNTRLALVGDGPYRAELERIFAGTNTEFVGYLRGEELSQAYASADAFVFPSSLETFGLVVVEAMAAGLPVIASQVGGIPDVVEEGVTGYTFPIGDVETFVQGVAQVTQSRETMQQMGQAARAYAAAQTWEHMNDEVIAHYERLLAAKQPQSMSA